MSANSLSPGLVTKLIEMLPKKDRKLLVWLLLLLIVSAMVEMAGVASVVPFLNIVADPKIIETDERLSRLYQTFEFVDDRQFLLTMGIVPVVNENDTTATTEIKYGDNDRLAARVSQIISADCLILLSDVDGLYTNNPKKNKATKLIGTVKEIDENIKKYATRAENLYGSGGMKTKIDAAKICQLSGCYMVIANGNHKSPIKKILKSKKCTWFLPKISKLDARKQWIIGSIAPKGEVIIDQGAVKAINNGKSLLPAGVKKITGSFEKGDHILVKDQNDNECARGLTSFSSIEIEKIKGSHSSKIKNILGYSSREEIIHKDDLAKV